MQRLPERPADATQPAPADGSVADPGERALRQALEEFEQRGEIGLEEFVRSRPQLAGWLRGQIDVLRRAGMLTPPPAAIAHGAQFGAYRVVRRLATGGMGVVYLATEVDSEQLVALKVVRPEFLLSEVARERFQREVEAVARLHHPGIVPILAVGMERLVPWFAMQFVDGASLDAVIHSVRAADPPQRSAAALRAVQSGSATDDAATAAANVFAGTYQDACVRIVLQAAEAMSYVHARGIVHRDLKPSNIMITPAGQALVLDFGLAHVQDLQRLTQIAGPIGSPAYMAPEQVRGDAVDERVDVYGLGVTLYELLATRHPFVADSDERLQQLVLDGACPPLDRSVGASLATVVEVAMDRDRNRRYRSMAEFAQDLGRVLARQPVRARRVGLPVRWWRRCQRHPVAAITIAALLFLALQFPVVLWWLSARTNAELVANNERLRAAQAQEAEARRQATLSFDDAIVAVHDLLEHTARQDLVATPGSEAVRLLLYRRAAAMYERLLERRPDDVRLVRDVASAWQRTGSLYFQMGDWQQAEGCYTVALQRIAALDDPEALASSGIARKLLGQSLLGRGEPVAARIQFELGGCDLESAVAIEPKRTWRLQSAEVLNSLALAHDALGQRERCLELLREAQQRKAEVLHDAPDDVAAATAFAIGCINLAKREPHRADASRSFELLDQGAAALLRVSSGAVDAPLLREKLAGLHDIRGVLHNERGQQEAAADAHGTALALRLELHLEFPNIAGYAADVGSSWHNLAMTWIARKRHEEALECDVAAVGALRRALTLAPQDRAVARHLEYALTGRCVSLLSLHRLDELDAATAELGGAAVTTEGLLNAARVRIRHAQLARERDADAAARLRQHGAELVALAVERGFRDRRHFERGAFAALYADLRGIPAYDDALARL